MIPFHTRFPELAARETRSLHVLGTEGRLPAGEYGFIEHYCADPSCDCRRVVLCVTSADAPHPVLATINYGWESPEFYTRWMHGNAEAGREITAASLDPLNPQSEYAEFLLECFQKNMLTDRTYVARLARHYELFKSTQIPGPAASPSSTMKTSMTPDEILCVFQNVPGRCEFAPYETALLAATAQREIITPLLIAALDSVSATPGDYLNRRENCLHVFAIYLLAQFREHNALDAFIRFFSLPGELSLDLTGDMITENGAAVIASVCGGDPAPLLRLIHDEAVNEYVRGQALEALLVQCVWGQRPREAVIADLRGLFSTLPRPGNPYIWAELVCAVNEFNAPELLPEAREAFAEGLVDESIVGLEDVDPDVKRRSRGYKLPTRGKLYDWFCERNAPIDAVTECSGWLCFRDEKEDAGPWDMDEADRLDDAPGLAPDKLPEYKAPKPYLAPPKIGRNDPCQCGSGKKYKKCCGKS